VTGLFGGGPASARVAEALSDERWLAALLEVEAALARAQATVGLIPRNEAEAIERACRSMALDADGIGAEAAATGTPVVPLVARLRAEVGEPAAQHVHRGATSQDILDSAAMLVARTALDAILEDIGRASDAAASLAAEHRDTLVAGRTLLQQALPTTFGLKAAGWMTGLDEAATGLRDVRDQRLAVQLGGAAGTLAAFGPAGPALVSAFAAGLRLAEPVIPWHSLRVRVAQVASALGVAAGAIAKPARDVVLLAQTEVGEVGEGVAGRGASSALPQKRNPIAAVSALAAAQQVPGLVATILALMPHEHERAAGGWQAEWLPLRSALLAVASAAAWLADCLEHLGVNAAVMSANVARSGGLIVAERIVAELAPQLGRSRAERIVASAMGDTAAGVLGADAALRQKLHELEELPDLDVDDLLDPRRYLGSAGVLVDAALAAHAEQVRRR
jgi:3-carboxy-cis,cis-muconate cycloisomerase